jgi:hypothetical protein
MRLWVTAGFALLAGLAACSSGPTRLVGGGAVLASVSYDQAWVAVLTAPTRQSNGSYLGTLEVNATSSALAAVTLDDRSDGGSFARGSALWFRGGVTLIDEGTPASPHPYGALKVWLPGSRAPIQIGDNVRDFAVSQDGSACIFMDWAQQTIDPSNRGKLVAVSTAGCNDGSCLPIVLATDVSAAQASWRLSDDGRFAFATVRGAADGDEGSAVLVTLASGVTQTLSTAAGTRAAMMTAGGDIVAWVEGDHQLQAAATANPTTTTTFALDAALIDTAELVDGTHYVAKVHAVASSDPASLVLVSATATTSLPLNLPPLGLFVSQTAPGTSTRYLFFSASEDAASGTRDLWLLDLLQPATPPLQLGARVEPSLAAAVALSDDGTALRYRDNFDVTTRRGDEYQVPLAAPARNLIATGISAAAFIPGDTRLLFVDAPDATSGAGVLTLLPALGQPTLLEGVGEVGFIASRTSPRRLYYTQHAGDGDDGVWYTTQP